MLQAVAAVSAAVASTAATPSAGGGAGWSSAQGWGGGCEGLVARCVAAVALAEDPEPAAALGADAARCAAGDCACAGAPHEFSSAGRCVAPSGVDWDAAEVRGDGALAFSSATCSQIEGCGFSACNLLAWRRQTQHLAQCAGMWYCVHQSMSAKAATCRQGRTVEVAGTVCDQGAVCDRISAALAVVPAGAPDCAYEHASVLADGVLRQAAVVTCEQAVCECLGAGAAFSEGSCRIAGRPWDDHTPLSGGGVRYAALTCPQAERCAAAHAYCSLVAEPRRMLPPQCRGYPAQRYSAVAGAPCGAVQSANGDQCAAERLCDFVATSERALCDASPVLWERCASGAALVGGACLCGSGTRCVIGAGGAGSCASPLPSPAPSPPPPPPVSPPAPGSSPPPPAPPPPGGNGSQRDPGPTAEEGGQLAPGLVAALAACGAALLCGIALCTWLYCRSRRAVPPADDPPCSPVGLREKLLPAPAPDPEAPRLLPSHPVSRAELCSGSAPSQPVSSRSANGAGTRGADYPAAAGSAASPARAADSASVTELAADGGRISRTTGRATPALRRCSFRTATAETASDASGGPSRRVSYNTADSDSHSAPGGRAQQQQSSDAPAADAAAAAMHDGLSGAAPSVRATPLPTPAGRLRPVSRSWANTPSVRDPAASSAAGLPGPQRGAPPPSSGAAAPSPGPSVSARPTSALTLSSSAPACSPVPAAPVAAPAQQPPPGEAPPLPLLESSAPAPEAPQVRLVRREWAPPRHSRASAAAPGGTVRPPGVVSPLHSAHRPPREAGWHSALDAGWHSAHARRSSRSRSHGALRRSSSRPREPPRSASRRRRASVVHGAPPPPPPPHAAVRSATQRGGSAGAQTLWALTADYAPPSVAVPPGGPPPSFRTLHRAQHPRRSSLREASGAGGAAPNRSGAGAALSV
eukprot:TRINITY_DN33722_c1_g1_i1.p1 TRINITY_DN33722_c1_g1~~TRINITY_DN33722_c1_g1_i1.p1  ORF type:complete len:958 (+),score=180.55 TRINITY_DN33722_c1_g1_i1:97-2874(+)